MTRALPLALGLAVLAAPGFAAEPRVDYPAGYRQWTHVKSMVIFSDKHPLFGAFGGIHHVYANPAAERALVKGGTFPDGAVLVLDLIEAKEEGGAWVEGPRKLVGVMHKSRAKWGKTGGWGFEGFKGDSRAERVVKDPRTECFGCHQSQRDNDFVFSAYRQ
jgi:hypothetical protein